MGSLMAMAINKRMIIIIITGSSNISKENEKNKHGFKEIITF